MILIIRNLNIISVQFWTYLRSAILEFTTTSANQTATHSYGKLSKVKTKCKKSTNAPMPLKKTRLQNFIKKIIINLAPLECQNIPAMTKQLKNQSQHCNVNLSFRMINVIRRV